MRYEEAVNAWEQIIEANISLAAASSSYFFCTKERNAAK